MHTTRTALRIGAVAAAISAVTTFLLWLLPRFSFKPQSSGAIGAAIDPFTLARLCVNFGHVFLAVVGYAGVAYVAARRSPAFAWVGLAAFAAWALTEAIGVSLNLWAVTLTWQPSYSAADPAERAALKAAILTVAGIWDALFFVVLITFLMGTLLLGLSLYATGGLARLIATLLILAAPLTVFIILDSYFGASLSGWINWLYPVLQPLSRGLMAIWLWREADLFDQPQHWK